MVDLVDAPRPVEIEEVGHLTERILAVYADICYLDVEAIVNPTHADLLGGGGLDRMIHDAAGPQLLEACQRLGGCAVGDSKTTRGFRLRARWVTHTVGPIWRGGSADEQRLLASCYRRCLEEVMDTGAGSVAFPGISTGLHRFPGELAAGIAVREVRSFLQACPQPLQVTFASFDNTAMRAYESALADLPA